MAGQIKIRRYCQGDEVQIVDLLNLVFTNWPRFDLKVTSLEHWIWKHRDSTCKSIVTVAESNEEIIGCWHRMTQKIKFGDHIDFISQGTDVAVHPDYRRMKISSKMRELAEKIAAKQGIRLLLGVNSNPIIRNSALTRGYVSLSNIFGYINIQDVDLHMNFSQSKNKLILKGGYKILSRYNQLSHRFYLRSQKVLDTVMFRDVTKFSDKMNLFWNDVKKQYNYITVRNRDYLNWRYCDPRGGDYVIKLAEEGENIVGYLVLRINKFEEYHKGYIVDTITSPERLDVIDSFIQNAKLFFKEKNVNNIRSWDIKDSISSMFLLKHGFVKMSEKYIQYKETRFENNSLAFTPLSFYPVMFSIGDSDHI